MAVRVIMTKAEAQRISPINYLHLHKLYCLNLVCSPRCTPVVCFLWQRWLCHFLYIEVIPVLFHGGKGEHTAQ